MKKRMLALLILLLCLSGCGGEKPIPMSTVEHLGLEDGVYTVKVSLTGGTGKSDIASPTKLIINRGKATAEILWSSRNYDYMLVDGQRYDFLDVEQGSRFEIPVAGFDAPLEVIADTVAMSTPHEIGYTLIFDSGSIQGAKE